MNAPRIHSAVLPYLSAHYAMEPRAQAQFLQRLLSISPEARLEEKQPTVRLFILPWGEDEDEEDEPVSRTSGKPYQIASGVAVLPLLGCLQPREDWITAWFPDEATATETFATNLRAAYADPDVTGVLLYVDSPGGLVSGTAEAAEAVYALRKQGDKPLVAFAPSLCCSAAYWIASQAEQLFCGETAWVGSIGTRLDLVDSTEFYAQLGLTVTPITTGTYKAAGADGTPITGDVKAYYQGLVDRVQQEFTAGVARGRGLKVGEARALAAEARIYVGGDAQRARLVDGLRNCPDVLKGLQNAGAQASASGVSPGMTAAWSGTERGKPMSLWDELRSRLGGVPDHEEKNEGAASGNGVAAVLEPHPLVAACQTAGFTKPEQVQAAASAITERDGLKAKYLTRLKADAQKAAIRSGSVIPETIAKMEDVETWEALIQEMDAKADKRYGVSATSGAQRKSEGQDLSVSADGRQAGAPLIDYKAIYDAANGHAANGKGA